MALELQIMANFVQFFTLSMNLHSNRVQLVPPTHKWAKIFEKSDFQLLFSRDWDIPRTNGHLR